MKTSIITKHQFLKSELLELVEISKLVELKDRFFILKFDQWLKSCEHRLKELGFAEASHFSVYKTQLFNCKSVKGRSKHKILFSKSVESIKLAQQTLYNLFFPLNQKITQAEETIENILVLVKDTNDFKKIDKQDFSRYVASVWQFISQQEVFQNHVNQLKVLISLTDIKLLLGQKLTI